MTVSPKTATTASVNAAIRSAGVFGLRCGSSAPSRVVNVTIGAFGFAEVGGRSRWLEYRPERDWLPDADRDDLGVADH